MVKRIKSSSSPNRCCIGQEAAQLGSFPTVARRAQVGFLLWSLGGAILGGGCGPSDGIERVPVTGVVTFQGQPLEVGQIRFIPELGTKGPVTIEKFRDGKYDTKASHGVPVGRHRVEIIAYKAQNYDNAPVGPGVPPVPQLLPPKFNVQSTLTVYVESGEKRKVCDFNLVP